MYNLSFYCIFEKIRAVHAYGVNLKIFQKKEKNILYIKFPRRNQNNSHLYKEAQHERYPNRFF